MRGVLLAVAEDVRAAHLEGLPAEVEVERFPAEGPPGPRVLDAEFVVPTRHAMAEALKRMPRLAVVQTISAGVDWVLPRVPKGVTLADARGVHDVAVSEWALSVLLAWVKRLPALFERRRRGQWARGLRPGELAGRTVLILGYGSIGRAVEARLAPFGVRVLRVARRPRAGAHAPDALPGLLPRADAVVLLLPLATATRGDRGRRLSGAHAAGDAARERRPGCARGRRSPAGGARRDRPRTAAPGPPPVAGARGMDHAPPGREFAAAARRADSPWCGPR